MCRALRSRLAAQGIVPCRRSNIDTCRGRNSIFITELCDDESIERDIGNITGSRLRWNNAITGHRPTGENGGGKSGEENRPQENGGPDQTLRGCLPTSAHRRISVNENVCSILFGRLRALRIASARHRQTAARRSRPSPSLSLLSRRSVSFALWSQN